MSCSWSDALRRALTPRLAWALAASLAAHALLVASLEGRFGAPSALSSLAAPVIRAALASEPKAAAAPAPKRAAGASLPAPPRYYRTRELDVVPGIMTRVHPEYPQLAHVSGKVVIRLFIDESGTVEHVAVMRADPPGIFEASARRAFLAARFTPGMKAGAPVRTQMVLELSYTHPQR